MAVTAEANIRTWSVDDGFVRSKLADTAINADDFLYFARTYNVDPNWALAYLQWESHFGDTPIGRANPTNPWDILSVPGQWGQVGEYAPGNGYSYATYPDARTGLEAGFRLWDSYASKGWDTWRTSLSVALCGQPDGCAGTWVESVIRQGQYNAGQSGEPTDTPVPEVGFPIGPIEFPVIGSVSSGALVGLGAAALLVLIVARRRAAYY